MLAEFSRRLSFAFDAAEFAHLVGPGPDPWQENVLRSPTKRLILCCSRQAGKSTVASVAGVHRAVFVPGSLVLLVSPSLRQSGELFKKTCDVFERVPASMRPKKREDSKTILALDNGSRIVSFPGSEATIRGFSGASLIIEDEASRVDDDLYRAVRPMLAVSGGTLVLMSTPFGKRGHFYEEWSGSNAWERVKIPATECPRIDPAFLAEERLALGDWWFAQEYGCEFGESIDSVFRTEDIRNALTEDVAPLAFPSARGLSDEVKPLRGV